MYVNHVCGTVFTQHHYRQSPCCSTAMKAYDICVGSCVQKDTCWLYLRQLHTQLIQPSIEPDTCIHQWLYFKVLVCTGLMLGACCCCCSYSCCCWYCCYDFVVSIIIISLVQMLTVIKCIPGPAGIVTIDLTADPAA